MFSGIDERELAIARARTSLKSFIHQSWTLVEPSTPLSWNWHIDVICEVMEAVLSGELKKVIFNIPPGTGKSLCTSVFPNAYQWTTNAYARWLTFSYSDDNTIRDNRRFRDIVTSDWYLENFWYNYTDKTKRPYEKRRVEFSSDQWAKVRLDNSLKGWRIASSVGGVGTGEHPDIIVIDDPIKAADALSENKLKGCITWFKNTLSTRIARDPSYILTMQRLHMDDLSAHCEELGWEVVRLPMRFDSKISTVQYDCRSAEGELLWSDNWPEEKVKDEETHLGPIDTAGQLQQHPVPVGGGLFKRDMIEIVDVAPVNLRECRGWDTAATLGAGDWTVGPKIGECEISPPEHRRGKVIRPGKYIYYVLDVKRAQESPDGVNTLMLHTAEEDGVDCMQREEQEPGSSGKSVISSRASLLTGYDYAGVTVTGDKLTRAKPFLAQWLAGNVKLVRGDWNRPYIDVMTSFPLGKHDDDVDGSSCAFNALVAERKKRYTRAVFGRGR